MEPDGHVFYAAPDSVRGDGWRSGAANVAMRATLAKLRGQAEQQLGLRAPRWSKLTSGAPAPESGWCWSASHARGHVALAVAGLPRIGLDLEPLDRPRPLHVAERLAELGADPATLADGEALIACWTRAEAVLKLHGVGLGGLGRLRFAVDKVLFDGAPQRLTALSIPGLGAALASDLPLAKLHLYPAAASLARVPSPLNPALR